jgi:hypothetical protein
MMKKRANTLHLHLCLPKGMDLNIHPSQPLDRHPGDTPAGQILVVVMTMKVVVVAEHHQLGETLAMIWTRMIIQVQAIIQKQIKKGIALPFVILLRQQDMSGASLTCWLGPKSLLHMNAWQTYLWNAQQYVQRLDPQSNLGCCLWCT